LIFFFSGIKLNTYFTHAAAGVNGEGEGEGEREATHEPSCLVFATFPYPVINCQGLSNLLGLLAVRLNELETALIYNNKIKLHRVRMLTNNMNNHY